jgi:hypothetical protein
MIAAAVLASLWAQAEPAPAPEPPPPAPVAAPAPLAAPLVPAPSQPLAPLVPVPSQPPAPAQPAPPPPPLNNSASVHLRYAYRLTTEGDATAPAAGVSLGGGFEHRFWAHESGFELSLGGDFFYDRFSKQVAALSTDASGALVGTVVDRTLSLTSFAVGPTIAWRRSDLRFFVALAAGVSIGYFVSPDLFQGSRTAAQRLARAVAGMDFALSARTAAVLRVDYNRSFDHENYGTYPLFGDVLDVGAGLLARF